MMSLLPGEDGRDFEPRNADRRAGKGKGWDFQIPGKENTDLPTS